VKSVGIVDYDICNIDSVARATEECGGRPVLARRPEDLADVAAIILPGVGSFPHAMRALHEHGFVEALRQQVNENGIPLLGLCLGMQLLASSGDEGGAVDGLGLIEGRVVKLESTADAERVPHIGWNEVYPVNDNGVFAGIPEGGDFYFVHSYHFVTSREEDVLARTPGYGEFTSVVGRDNVIGTQFHPEKSQRLGFALLRNFIAL
jgi:glutamine amidotransferase